jgi:predicted TIM-barrel fold metal-dependent hydrolase
MLALDYPVIDADAHVNEPPDLWQTRLPIALREKGPRVERGDDGGDWWFLDGGRRRRPVGLTVLAGLSFLDYRKEGFTYAGIRPSNFEPEARLNDMELDGVAAQVLYPSVALSGAKAYAEDRELQVACVRAYNDWLADFCAAAPDRLHGVALIPSTGLDDALNELDHATKRGHKAAMISAYPSGKIDPDPEVDDRFWAALQEIGLPAAVHIGSFTRQPLGGLPLPAQTLSLTAFAKSGGPAMQLAGDFIVTGIPERFPRLKLLLVEANIGWIPAWLEQLDDNYLRHRHWTGVDALPRTPSEYFYRQFYSTFMVDRTGVELRHRCGLDRIMWSTDFPHAGSDWPNSRLVIAQNFAGVPPAEVKLMLHDTAAELFRVPL